MEGRIVAGLDDRRLRRVPRRCLLPAAVVRSVRRARSWRARPGVLDERRAASVAARAVVPVANAPYTAGALETLRAVGVAAHADFVASAVRQSV
jgi:hypothetical protein